MSGRPGGAGAPVGRAAQRVRILIGAVVVLGGGLAVILAGDPIIGGALVALAAGSVAGTLVAERRARRRARPRAAGPR